jgi:murein DD-endopeptidase MepM/ murein hydrolase activator NlpD
VKRAIILLITTALLSSCVGNASLWGQYQTPTPPGGSPPSLTPATPFALMDTPTPANVFVSDIFPSPTPEYTATPTSLLSAFVTQPPTETPPPATATFPNDALLYYAQSGDWLPAVASRFGVSPSEITSPKILPETGFIDQGTLLLIPNRIDYNAAYTSPLQFIPDSEVVYSANALDFDIDAYVKAQGGYLASYREYLGTTAWTTGAQGVGRLAAENSINPRLLLAVLDYEAQWVRGRPANEFRTKYPMGYESYRAVGMFGQLTWAINQLSAGFYGWRSGRLDTLTFLDGQTLRLDPTLNAGTVAVMVMFSRLHTLNEWLRIMDQNSGFPAFYEGMFGDPWVRAERNRNFFPPNFSQPVMTLPFEWNATWSYTGGPHSAWGTDGPLAALDFAPRNDTSGCYETLSWVTAVASGLVVRSGNGVVVIDMDGDGHEQTGWNIMYLHIASKDRVPAGVWVDQGDRIGHASCEGGVSTGTHTHIARKYNGEWMLADGPVPFNLSGWTAVAGDKPYLGKLVKGSQSITADVYGQSWSLITRKDDE